MEIRDEVSEERLEPMLGEIAKWMGAGRRLDLRFVQALEWDMAKLGSPKRRNPADPSPFGWDLAEAIDLHHVDAEAPQDFERSCAHDVGRRGGLNLGALLDDHHFDAKLAEQQRLDQPHRTAADHEDIATLRKVTEPSHQMSPS
jgi:hypothetical protein